MAEREIAIEVSHVTKKYKLYERNRDRVIDALGWSKKPHYTEKLALNDVSMTVYRGETVGIIGTNGSGKSTILKIITGVLTQSSGSVTVNGRISALLELGAGFNMEYNGIDNIYLNGTMIGYSEEEIKEKIPAILEFADIGEYIYQPVKSYSSGMFMRLAFAVAINIDPEILIVDEALAVGDVFFQAKCYHKFDEFKREGKTVIFVSHDMSSIGKYCDRVVLLNQGVKLGEGSPKEMIDIYKQVLVGQYNADANTDRVVRNTERMPAGGGLPGGAGSTGAARLRNTAGTAAAKAAAAKDAIATDAGDGTQNTGGQASSRGSFPTADGADSADGAEIKTAETGTAGNVPEDNADSAGSQVLDYGSGKAKITYIDILDNKGLKNSTILKGSECTIRMTVTFYEDVPAPIFAFTIKNKYGVEITGTNTMFERAFLEPVNKGDVKSITFHQKVDLQGGEYLISFGCTGYEGNDFTVYHRLYDALNLTVVSTKNSVGFYDMNSQITVTDGTF